MSDAAITDPRAHAQQRVGNVLRGKWALDNLIGVGGMAAVYAATHRNGGRVAIKMLSLQFSADDEIRKRFLREGYVANRVGHSGAVRVIDDDVAEDGSVFLVMDLLVGETLESRRERKGGTLAAEEVVPIVDRLLDILVAAHAQGIVHRDVKPENVFLTDDASVKLLDFGIARLQEMSQVASMMTVSGSMLGTPAFMPPEQALGHVERIDARSDVWAVGAVMFTLLTGQFVHHGTRTVNELLVAAASKPAPRIGSVAPSVPKPIADLVDRALAFDPNARWPDAAAMQHALRLAQEALGWTALTVQMTQPSRPVGLAEARTVAHAKHPLLLADPSSSVGVFAAPPEARGRRHAAFATAVLVVVGLVVAAAFTWRSMRGSGERSAAGESIASESSTPASVAPSGSAPIASAAPIESARATPAEPAPTVTAGHVAPPSTATASAASAERPIPRPNPGGKAPRSADASSSPASPRPAGDSWLDRQH